MWSHPATIGRPRHRGEGDARLPDAHRQRHQNRDGHERRGDAERPVADAQHLRHRPDQIDVVVRHVGHDAARAQHEHHAMTGAAMNTERVTDRAGALVSPARIAMYSKPPERAEAHLPEDVQVVERELGNVRAEGMVFGERAGEQADHGSSTTAPKIVIMKTPPVLCTHLPTDRPMVEVTTINDRISRRRQRREPAAARHPRRARSDRIREIGAHCRPISDVNTIT
jgi:hypothetical protein